MQGDVRILPGPTTVHAALALESTQALGPIRHTLVFVALLQFYWFALILKSLKKKKSTAEPSDARAKAKGS